MYYIGIMQEKLFIPRCSFCNKEDFKVIDVKSSETIKSYTDSPYFNSFQSKTGNTFGNTFKGATNFPKDLIELRSAGFEEKYHTPHYNNSHSYEDILGVDNQLISASAGFPNHNCEDINVSPVVDRVILSELISKGIIGSPSRMNMGKCIY